MSTHNNYNYYTTRRATKEDWWRALLWDTHLFRTGHVGVGMEFVLFLFLYHYYYPSFYHFLTRDSLFLLLPSVHQWWNLLCSEYSDVASSSFNLL